MLRKIHIARGEAELGILTEAETVELLRAGFLLPTDHYWTGGMPDWKSLAEFKPEPEGKKSSAALMKLAKQTINSATESAVAHAARLTSKLKSVAGSGRSRFSASTNQMLDSFTPQIQKLVSNQLLGHSVARLQAAIHDDEFMRRLFGATYDCLPKPIHRFITEQAFIEFCLDRRQKLVGSTITGPGKG